MAQSLNPTVLVVDDSDTIRRLVRLYLRDEEFEVIGEARDGETAVTLVAEKRPDIVIMDVHLPGIDGYEATEQITAAFPDTLVIVISGSGKPDAARRAMGAGARDYLVKPLQREQLLQTLRNLHETPASVMIHGSGRADARGTGSWGFLGMNVGDGRSALMVAAGFELVTEGHKVLLVDTNPLLGDLNFQLGLNDPSPALTELLDHASFLRERVIRSHIRNHDSGLHVLAGSLSPEDAYAMDATKLVELMPTLEEFYDYVLVDISGGLPEQLAPLLDRARFVLPVDQASPGGLRNLLVLHDILSNLGYKEPKLKPVLMGVDERGSEYWTEGSAIEAAIGIEDDPMLRHRAIRAGQPVPRVDPRSPFSLAVRGFTRDMLSPRARLRTRPSQPEGHTLAPPSPEATEPPNKQGFFARFFKRG